MDTKIREKITASYEGRLKSTKDRHKAEKKGLEQKHKREIEALERSYKSMMSSKPDQLN